MKTKLKTWLLRKLIAEKVKQGNQHAGVEMLFGLIMTECRAEFPEDNDPTLKDFLMTGFETAYNKS